MDTIRIANLQERDFDVILEAAGAKRIDTPDKKTVGQTADDRMGNSIIELKLLKEEGMEKSERQRKLAELFVSNQPNRPIVVLSPNLLSENERREYYRIMETPIKSHVAKATKQLKESVKKYQDIETTVLLLANIGYNSLDIDEFEDVGLPPVIVPLRIRVFQ